MIPARFRRKPPYRVVHVVWRDAHHVELGAWSPVTGADDVECVCTTVGWLIRTTPHFHVIAHTVQADDVTGVFAIPTVGVISIRFLT